MGIAISDSLKIIASGIENFHYENEDLKICLNKINEIIKKYENDVDTIVIGKPLNINGTINNSTIRSQKFFEMLSNNLNKSIKITYWDERYTTKIATSMLKEINLKSSKIKKIIDKMSAVVILQDYLDNHHE